jgi:hypothetical protein
VVAERLPRISGRLMGKGMRQILRRMPIIPPTQLVVRSHSTYGTQSPPRANPTNAVGGSFIPNLQWRRAPIRFEFRQFGL